MSAYTRQTKSAINLRKLPPNIIHKILNMSIHDCDKLRPILAQYSGGSKNHPKDLKSHDVKPNLSLGSKFWKSLFGLM